MPALDVSDIRYAVVVAPHSDDETIGAFHMISALRGQNARVDVVVVTDGSASHRNSPTWPKSRLVETRRIETEKAMNQADVSATSIAFLDLPDGGLTDLTWSEKRRTVDALRCRPIPDLVISPSLQDDHPDHRAVAKLCRRAWGPAIRSLSYLVWPRNADRLGSDRYYVDGNIAAKHRALLCYQTQLGMIRDDPDGFELTPEMQARMCTSREWFSC